MTTAPVASRCAVHPGRTGFDNCPVCARPRCLQDARRLAERGCAACIDSTAPAPASPLELGLRGSLAAMPVALVGGWIAAEYVDVHIFSWAFPGVLGLAATSLVGLASYRRGLGAVPVTMVGAIAGLLGTALGFRLYPNGPHEVLRPWSLVGLPYLCSIGGAALWSVLLRPPRRVG